jgi:hypothetical protein
MLLETKIVKDDGYQKQQGQILDTRNVSDNILKLCCRHLDSMDGDQWHGYGPELSGSRWLRSHLVRMLIVLPLPRLRIVADRQKGIR